MDNSQLPVTTDAGNPMYSPELLYIRCSCRYIHIIINKTKLSFSCLPNPSKKLISRYFECAYQVSKKTPNIGGKERGEGKKMDGRRRGKDERKSTSETFQSFGILTLELDVDRKMR